MLETPGDVKFVVKKINTDKLAANRIFCCQGLAHHCRPLATVKTSTLEEPCQPWQRSLLPLRRLRSQHLPCVYRSKLTVNEINKFRLSWQPASKVIILSLMSPHQNGRRLGLNGNTTGCGKTFSFFFPAQRSDE